jgi:subtilase family serine protease
MNALKFLTMIVLLSLLAQGVAPAAHAAPGLPDLTVDAVWCVYSSHLNTSNMWYTVKNIGAAASPAFRIRIVDPNSGAVIQSFNTAGLLPGASRSYYVLVRSSTVDRRIILDPANLVTENNENNNRRTHTGQC